MVFVLPRIASQSQKHHTSYRLTDDVLLFVSIFYHDMVIDIGLHMGIYIYMYIYPLIIVSPGYGSNGLGCSSSPARPG